MVGWVGHWAPSSICVPRIPPSVIKSLYCAGKSHVVCTLSIVVIMLLSFTVSNESGWFGHSICTYLGSTIHKTVYQHNWSNNTGHFGGNQRFMCAVSFNLRAWMVDLSLDSSTIYMYAFCYIFWVICSLYWYVKTVCMLKCLVTLEYSLQEKVFKKRHLQIKVISYC